MRTNSGADTASQVLGERVVAAVEEAARNDSGAYGRADGEEVDALTALSAALSASEGFGNQIATLLRAERSAREELRSSAALTGEGRAPTACTSR